MDRNLDKSIDRLVLYVNSIDIDPDQSRGRSGTDPLSTFNTNIFYLPGMSFTPGSCDPLSH